MPHWEVTLLDMERDEHHTNRYEAATKDEAVILARSVVQAIRPDAWLEAVSVREVWKAIP
jgi:hypothetical protein